MARSSPLEGHAGTLIPKWWCCEMGQTVTFNRPSDDVIAAITATLAGRGYRIVRSFDLQNARIHYAKDCPCPHHGTSQCTCQYVVLLAYPQARAGDARAAGSPNPPCVMTAHSNGQLTLVTFHCDETVHASETSAVTRALIKEVLLLAPHEPARALG